MRPLTLAVLIYSLSIKVCDCCNIYSLVNWKHVINHPLTKPTERLFQEWMRVTAAVVMDLWMLALTFTNSSRHRGTQYNRSCTVSSVLLSFTKEPVIMISHRKTALSFHSYVPQRRQGRDEERQGKQWGRRGDRGLGICATVQRGSDKGQVTGHQN